MAIRYYPTSRVQTGLNTKGDLFTLNGQPYTGPYYATYDGKAFTGPNPAAGQNELLIPIGTENTVGAQSRQSRLSSTTKVAGNIKQAFSSKPSAPTIHTHTGAASIDIRLKQLTPYYPIVTELDYTKGYFTRYFAKKVNMNSYLLEISYENWAMMENNEDNTFEDYEVIDLFWQLTGPEHDIRLSQYQIRGGVYDTNKRIVEGKAKGFNGLVEFIGGEYTKYARIDK